MKSMFRCFNRTIQVFLVLLGIAYAFPAQAAYKYTSIDFPGAQYTELFGINRNEQIVGEAFVGAGEPAISFVYDRKKKIFTVLPNVPSAFSTSAVGINISRAVTGGVGDGNIESGFVLSDGAFRFFAHPGYPFTQGRAINNSGLVTGWAADSSFTHTIGFTYDPTQNAFVDFLPSTNTIAQGINGAGQVVGSTRQLAGVVCSTCPETFYGFRRNAGGATRYFLVNGQSTRARGITGVGVITGIVGTGASTKGFVVTLTGTAKYQALTIPDANLLVVPGATATIPEGINGLGCVVGYWTDGAGLEHGFIATPN